MKYEVSQGQYRDFLNMLTRAQQNTRTETNVSTDAITNVFVMSNSAVISFRSGIACPASGNGTTAAITFGVDGEATPDSVFNESNDGEWRAANYLSWMDLAAYADWAALRPMTELEYEKASRGPTAAVSGEYAWGSTTIDYFSDLLNDGTSSEAKGSTRPNANCNYSSATPDGPIRCGMFATSSSTRELAGVSYYGVMELSGNVWERCVTVGNSTGRNFTGTHGDGVLTTALTYEGNATNSDWPGMDGTTSRGVTGATGSGFRGGNWYLGGATSDRSSAAVTDTTRSSFYGARAVRTSP
jgi:formylglycine-generating enzyme required for sulfatase activity